MGTKIVIRLTSVSLAVFLFFTLLPPAAQSQTGFPELKLPWKASEKWYFTGGPHGWGNVGASGIDFAPLPDASHTVLAAAAGTVTHKGTLVGEPTAGNVIKVLHDGGWETWYLHLADFDQAISVGEDVVQGATLGTAGTSGGVALHIHIELVHNGQHDSWDGRQIDGWKVYSKCTDGPPGCEETNYNGYIEKDGRKILPRVDPEAEQLITSSNQPLSNQPLQRKTFNVPFPTGWWVVIFACSSSNNPLKLDGEDVLSTLPGKVTKRVSAGTHELSWVGDAIEIGYSWWPFAPSVACGSDNPGNVPLPSPNEPQPPPNAVPPPVASTDSAVYISDVTYPDGSSVASGQNLVKTWRMKNTGSTTWGAGYTLEFRGGHNFSAGAASIPVLTPGQSGEIRLPLQIPSGLAPGQYRGDWQLRTPSGQYFGDRIWYSLRVGGSGGGGSSGGTITVRVAPGEVFSPAITVAAPAGGMSASSGDMLRHNGPIEERFGAYQHVAVGSSVAAGATYRFTMNDPPMRAPTSPGTYRSTWRLWVRGAYVGQPYTIELTVVPGGSSQPSAPPHRPTALTPTDLSVFVAQQPKLCARANGDPEGHAVEEFYFETFESAHLWASGWVRDTCATTSGLPPANYQWRVKVRDSTGAVSEWSERLRFSLDSDQVTITDLSFNPPSPSAVDTVIVRGSTAGCAGTIGGLRVFVNTAADGTNRGDWVPIVGELGVATYDDTNAPRWDTLEWESGTHLVRLQARSCDTAGTVRVRDLPYLLQHRRPSRPFLIAPTDGAWSNRREITFSWHAAKRAVDYRIVVGTTPDPLAAPLLDQVTTATSVTTTFNQPHPTLYWTVIARNDRGETSVGSSLLGIDEAAPESAIDRTRTSDLSFERPIPVFWSGEDLPRNVRHSGVRDFDVQVRRPFETGWRDWLTNYADAGEIYASPRYSGVDGQIYCFRTRASDNADNEELYGTDPDQCVTVDPTQRPPQPWWDSGYAAKRNLVLLNRLPVGTIVPAQYPVRLRFDTTTDPTAAEIVAGSRANGNDLRIIYNDTKPLNRVVTTFSSASVEIWFPLEVPLTDSDQTSYQLYYENPAASDPGYQLRDVLQPRLDAETRLLLYFEEESGGFVDASGRNNHGSVVGVVVRGEGKFRQGLTLNGQGYVRVENSPSIQGINRTLLVEAWVKPSQLDSNTRNIIARLVPGRQDSWRMFTRGGGEIVFDIVAPTGAPVRLIATSRFQIGQWTHIAGVVDGARVRLFVNGREEVSQAFTQELRNSDAWLAVGSTGYDNERFIGTIDQVHVSAMPTASFPYASISSEPSAAVGDEQRQEQEMSALESMVASSGMPDLAIQSLSAYPVGGGAAIVQVEMVNRGDQATRNEPVVTLYQNHVPSGPNDFAAAIAHLDHTALAPGQIVTMTVRIDLAALQPTSADRSMNLQLSLAAQVDSLGTLPDTTRSNNIMANIPLCVALADEFEGDDVVAQAKVIPLGKVQLHTFDKVEDSDWVKFTATAGMTYSMHTFDLEAASDTQLALYSSNGTTLLASNDDYGDSLASRIEWTAPASGTYYLQVRHWNPNAGGCNSSYKLSLTADNIQLFLPFIRR